MVKTNGTVKARCDFKDCNVKLGMLAFDCKCNNKYCSKHRLPETHECNYEHNDIAKLMLADTLFNESIETKKLANKL